MQDIVVLFAGDLIPPDNHADLFSESLKALLRNKDLSFVNLEAPLTIGAGRILKTGQNVKASLQGISAVKDGNFDAVTLANNHIRDFGDDGISDTLKTLKENQVLSVGAGRNFNEASRPLRINVKGVTISILNYCETEFNIATSDHAGANPFNAIRSYYEIRKEKELNNYLFVVYHGGEEYLHFPTPQIVERFKFMADAGADAIISHHTHRYSGVLNYNGKLLFFGLGNFLTPTHIRAPNIDWRTGLIVKLKIREGIIDYELFPVRMSETFSTVDIPDTVENKRILIHIDEISELIKDNTYLESYWQNEYLSGTTRIKNLLSSRCPFGYKIKKHLPFVSNYSIKRYKLLNLLGMVQNDTHRIRLIESLKNLLSEKKR